ncbi:MAG: alginate export family protein, partial [Pseudomonadales bacterium]
MFFGGVAISEEVASPSADISNLITGGDIDLSLRYRYEYVDQDGIFDPAKASTVRSRLSLQSGTYRSFDLFAEVDHIREVGADDFNAGAGNTPNRTQYPVVADPEGTEVNQAYLDYNASKSWSWRLGRQRINLDNQRFVGGVGWRQNEQTFDALSAVYQHTEVMVRYIYVSKVRRIFGDDVVAGSHEQAGTHLLNVSGEVEGLGKISGYYYRIDNEDAPASSTDTYGFRLSGLKDVDGFKARYTVEYAAQKGITDNPVHFGANYWNLDAGVIFGDFDIGLGWEVLTGDADSPGEAFRTPFATLHAFNGWADQFLTTPAAGLDDRYLKFKATRGKAIVQMRYHDFEAEDGGTDFGD